MSGSNRVDGVRVRPVALGVLSCVLIASSAHAQTGRLPLNFRATVPASSAGWHIDFRQRLLNTEPPPAPLFSSIRQPPLGFRQDAAQPLHAAAVEHSQAYQTRAKIHKYASFATLPLFAAEVALGQSLYNTPANAGGKRAAHGVVGAGIVGLFGVNTVTGAWNLFGEGWSEKDGRAMRLVHGLLMMAADVGFLATTASGPSSHGLRGAATFEANKVTHRNIAVASMSIGTLGYLIMLFGNR